MYVSCYMSNPHAKMQNAAEQKYLGAVKVLSDPARIRTWNPLIRSQMPYPLGHRAFGVKIDLRRPLRMRIVGVMKVKKFSDPARIRTWNPLIRSQMPYPLGHRALGVKIDLRRSLRMHIVGVMKVKKD